MFNMAKNIGIAACLALGVLGTPAAWAAPPPEVWPLVSAADFNGDGKADVLWRNRSTGQNVIWLMNGAALSAGALITTVADLNWQIVGVGDFNGDGKSDILWRHAVTGQNSVWLMNGTALASAALTNTVADLNWKVVGTGDFDGDGKSDVLWRNSSTGQNVIWLMNGTTLSSGALITTVADLNWQIVGVGDFDGDHKADILWRHAGTGQNSVWLMNGFTLASGALTTTVTDFNWKVVGTGDFNGDGKSDVLWRNSSTGQNVIWLMNGTALSGGALITTVTDLNWQIVGVGDFDGDHKSDILWRHAGTGQNSVWLMNGYTLASGVLTTTVADLNWVVQPASGGAPVDTTPDAFSFTPQTGLALSTVATSNAITVSGINAAANISVSGGSYSVNGGGYTTVGGQVNNGNTVTVRLTSSGSYSTQLCATLTIGGVSGQFCATTQAPPADTTPDAFSFTPQNGVALSTVATSNPITVSGINAAANISVSGGSYSVNGGGYTTVGGQVNNGNTVTVRLTTSGSYGTQLCATLTIGGVSGQFCATTLAPVTVTLYPSADNLTMYNSTNTAIANAVYQSGELAVGCNWSYWYDGLAGMWIQDVICAQSLAKFNVATLAGKTIDNATLKLTTNYYGVGYYPRPWHVRALATAWAPTTVTWNITESLSYYLASNINLSPPTYSGQIYNIDLTATVQAWANGSYANNGLIFGSNDYSWPYATSYDAFAFYSIEAGSSWGPILTVTYH